MGARREGAGGRDRQARGGVQAREGEGRLAAAVGGEADHPVVEGVRDVEAAPPVKGQAQRVVEPGRGDRALPGAVGRQPQYAVVAGVGDVEVARRVEDDRRGWESPVKGRVRCAPPPAGRVTTRSFTKSVT